MNIKLKEFIDIPEEPPVWARRKRGRPPVPESLARKWAELHIKKGWTLTGLAIQFGYSIPTIHKYVKKYRHEFE